MKRRLIFLSLLLFIAFCATRATALKNFDRNTFYTIVKSGTLSAVDDEVAVIQSSGLKDKDAFEGTLLMKKAGLVSKSKDKLDLFKKGRIKLETVIKNNSANAEYRFMRLIIQEHAPKQAKYHDELKTDADFIEKNFRNLSPELQDIIIDYSKQSNTLKTTNLQQ